MRTRVLLCLLTLAIVVSGCIPSYTVSPKGDKVRIETKEHITTEGEFLWMTDSDLVIKLLPPAKTNADPLMEATVVHQPVKSVTKVTALGYRNDYWLIVAGTQAFSALLLGIVGANYTSDGNGFMLFPIFAIIPAIEFGLFTARNSNPSYLFPLNDEDQTQIVKHARFVQPPTAQQQAEYFRSDHLVHAP